MLSEIMSQMQSGVISLCVIEGTWRGYKKELAQAGRKNLKGVVIAFDKIEEMLRE